MVETIVGHEGIAKTVLETAKIGKRMSQETMLLLTEGGTDAERMYGGGTEATYDRFSYLSEDKTVTANRLGIDEEDSLEGHQHPEGMLPSGQDIKTRTKEFEESGKDAFLIYAWNADNTGVLKAYFNHAGKLIPQKINGERVDVSVIDMDAKTKPYCTIQDRNELGNSKALENRALHYALLNEGYGFSDN